MATRPPLSAGLIVFDYDGVLVNSLDAMIRATRTFCSAHGIKTVIDGSTFDKLDPATFVAVARAAEIPKALTSTYAKYLFHNFRSEPEQSPIFTGIPELLINLERHYTTAIVSANNAEVIRSRLRAAGLEKTFSALIGNESSGTKPDHIRTIMYQTGHREQETWMIGDTVSDIEAAQTAGVHAIATTWGWQTKAFLASRMPEQLFDTIAEIEDYFLQK